MTILKLTLRYKWCFINLSSDTFIEFQTAVSHPNRNRDAVARLRHQLNEMQDQLDSGNVDASGDTLDDSNEDLNLKNNNNEVFMLLTGEQDLVKFLHWAMQLLYPHQHPIDDLNGSAADFYHPGMFIWKKFNFSGHLEPPLIVDEPHYVLVRREKQNLKHGYQLGGEHA